MSKELELRTIAEYKEYASLVQASDILPTGYRGKPANVVLATEVAASLLKSPYLIMQEMAIISGRPSFSAKFMRALVREAGHRLRESITDGVARCVIVRHDDPEFEHIATWDRKKAEAHQLWGKGHWTKNPELMLGNRALSECVRSACPEVLGGVAYTPDEVRDFADDTPARVTVTHTPSPAAPADAVPVDASMQPMTEAQRTEFRALLLEVGLSGQEAVGSFVVRCCGDGKTWQTLTVTDGEFLLAALRDWLAEGADPTTGEVVQAEVVDDPEVAS